MNFNRFFSNFYFYYFKIWVDTFIRKSHLISPNCLNILKIWNGSLLNKRFELTLFLFYLALHPIRKWENNNFICNVCCGRYAVLPVRNLSRKKGPTLSHVSAAVMELTFVTAKVVGLQVGLCKNISNLAVLSALRR